jgi:hypothetical protein
MINNELETQKSAELNNVSETALTRPSAARLNQATWVMWWAGTALIVLSWFNVVSNVVGWIGFSATLASSFISVIANRFWKFPK